MRRLQLVVQLELLRLPTAELQLMRRRLRWRRLLPVLARMRRPRLLGVQQELQCLRRGAAKMRRLGLGLRVPRMRVAQSWSKELRRVQ